jgi:hypothetical protein
MFTVQQIRDTFWAMQYQSVQKEALDHQISRTQHLLRACSSLDEYDKQLQKQITENNECLAKKV